MGFYFNNTLVHINIANLLVLFLITLIATIFFVYSIQKILIKADIGDKPIVTEHKHKIGTPTMGGIGMLLAVLLVASIYFKNPEIMVIVLIIVSAGIVGFIDDLIGLKVKEVQKIVTNISSEPVKLGQLTVAPGDEVRAATPKAKKEIDSLVANGKMKIIGEASIKYETGETEKIIAQIVLGIFLAVTGVFTTIGGYYIGLLAIPVSIVAIVGAINTVNLIDGMDGLAAGIIAIASFANVIFLYLSGNIEGMVPFVLLTALTLGFLVFNRYPASIFMGDTGSFALGAGYVTAALITNNPYFGALALAVPIFSVVVSLLHRSKIIRLPVEPLHHTLHHKGMSEVKIVATYYLSTIVICVIGLVSYYFFFM